MKIASIQLNAEFADVASNLEQCEDYISQVASVGAELVVLPEFFSSAMGFSDQMLEVARQNKNVANWLKQLADKYKIIIGGSYISFDGDNAFNLFQLTFPSGEIYVHKKDIPTQFENCYYTEGDNINVLVTPIGNFGVALCWEMLRYDTLKRIAGKVDLVLSGSCWWDLPIDAPIEREPLRQFNQNLACGAPVTFAKLSGVPVVHANHCGIVAGFNFPDADKLQTRKFVGAAQIVDGKGQVLAKRNFFEGGGFVMAEILWKKSSRNAERIFSDKYWIPDLPDSYIHAWDTINPKGRQYYKEVALPYYKNCR